MMANPPNPLIVVVIIMDGCCFTTLPTDAPAPSQEIRDRLLSTKRMGVCQALSTRASSRTGCYVEAVFVDGGSGKVITTGTCGNITAPETWKMILTYFSSAWYGLLLPALGIPAKSVPIPTGPPKDQDLHLHFTPHMDTTSTCSAAAAVSVISLYTGYVRRDGVALAGELNVNGVLHQSCPLPHNLRDLCLSQGISKLVVANSHPQHLRVSSSSGGDGGVVVVEKRSHIDDCLFDLLMADSDAADEDGSGNDGEGDGNRSGGAGGGDGIETDWDDMLD